MVLVELGGIWNGWLMESEGLTVSAGCKRSNTGERTQHEGGGTNQFHTGFLN